MNELHLIQFTMAELDLIVEALGDSSGMRSDLTHYTRCVELRTSILLWKTRQEARP